MNSRSTREIGLVSCVKSKRDEPAVPKNLYTSPYFDKMRSYADREHDDWWILSAKYGLVDPDGDSIEPYDETLTGASVDRKRAWGERVFAELDDAGFVTDSTSLVIHAGKSYYEELLPLLEDATVQNISIPTEGLQFGETLAWYNSRL